MSSNHDGSYQRISGCCNRIRSKCYIRSLWRSLKATERATEVCHENCNILRLTKRLSLGKKRQHAQEEEADRPYPDISTALCILTNIMASEFEDFSEYTLLVNGCFA